ncbi:YegP family protein [Robertkochia flava]|uniref:YegP family protein n=1 Tax=Robertkochia flava TaxID=3447986 RepID=UPI001CCB035E|nr:YegP family protein [Robertkochia marina]
MFEIFQSDKNQKFYFNLKANNGQIILSSQGYESKNGAEKGIKSVMDNADDDGKYERKTASNGKFHFNLKAANGQVIGSSQMYTSEAGMENGISSVKNHAAGAKIKDLSVE